VSTSITTLTGTPQDGIDAVVAFLMTNQQASDAFIPHRKEYALLIAQEFGLSEEICGEIINKLLDDANQTKLFAARKIMDAMSLIAAVEAPTVALERLIAAAAEVGIMLSATSRQCCIGSPQKPRHMRSSWPIPETSAVVAGSRWTS